MAAVGLRGVLKRPGEAGGLELTAKTDALAVRTTSEAARGTDGGNLAPAKAHVTRLRAALEGAWHGIGVGGGALVPTLELGARHDAGDAVHSLTVTQSVGGAASGGPRSKGSVGPTRPMRSRPAVSKSASATGSPCSGRSSSRRLSLDSRPRKPIRRFGPAGGSSLREASGWRWRPAPRRTGESRRTTSPGPSTEWACGGTPSGSASSASRSPSAAPQGPPRVQWVVESPG